MAGRPTAPATGVSARTAGRSTRAWTPSARSTRRRSRCCWRPTRRSRPPTCARRSPRSPSPSLVVQGDADLSAPIEITGQPTAALLRRRPPRGHRRRRPRPVHVLRRRVERRRARRHLLIGDRSPTVAAGTVPGRVDLPVGPPPPPHDWRWVVGRVGKVLIAIGLLMFGFVAYQLWGTGIEYRQAQDALDDDFDELLADTTTHADHDDGDDGAADHRRATDHDDAPATTVPRRRPRRRRRSREFAVRRRDGAARDPVDRRRRPTSWPASRRPT